MKNIMLKLASKVVGFAASNSEATNAINHAYGAFKGAMKVILPLVLGVLALVGIIYGVSLGIKFAKAEDTDARDKAKGQLINLAIGIGVAIAITAVCLVLVEKNVFQGLFNGAFGDSSLLGGGAGGAES